MDAHIHHRLPTRFNRSHWLIQPSTGSHACTHTLLHVQAATTFARCQFAIVLVAHVSQACKQIVKQLQRNTVLGPFVKPTALLVQAVLVIAICMQSCTAQGTAAACMGPNEDPAGVRRNVQTECFPVSCSVHYSWHRLEELTCKGSGALITALAKALFLFLVMYWNSVT